MASLAAFIPGFLKRRKRAAEEEEAHELRSSLYSASRAVLVEACVELHAAHKALAQRNAELQRMLAAREQPAAGLARLAHAPVSSTPANASILAQAGDASAQPQAVGVAESEFAKAVREAAARAASMVAAGVYPVHPARLPHAYAHLAGVPWVPSAPQSYGGTPAPFFPSPAMPAASVQEIVMAHADACGKIIGYGGETISLLQAQTGANIKLQRQDAGESRRVGVTITGAPACVAAAKRLVEEILTEPAPLSLGLIGGGYTGMGGGGGQASAVVQTLGQDCSGWQRSAAQTEVKEDDAAPVVNKLASSSSTSSEAYSEYTHTRSTAY